MKQQLREVEAHLLSTAHEDGDNALIIDGKALSHGLAADLRQQLLLVSMHIQAEVCLLWLGNNVHSGLLA